MEILQAICKRLLLFDGAMGTMLQKSGMKLGELPELFNIHEPSLISNIHKEYVEAGADIITTNTFQANRYKLKESGYSVVAVIEAGVKVAKASGATWVALDIGPIGRMMKPLGEVSLDEAYEVFKEQVIAGAKAGADLILIETISDIYEAKAAVLAAKENSQLPVICTMTFQGDGRTFLGTDPLTAATVLQALGVDCLGINCSLGPKEMLPILKELLKYTNAPVLIQSNAGLPAIIEAETVFPVGPKEFAEYAREMALEGVQLLGGCCGTTPEHIREIRTVLEGFQPVKRTPVSLTTVASGTKTVILDNKTTIIGERINPTGKKRLKEALRNNQLEVLLAEAIEQTNAGAEVLDVNVGLPEIDEVKMLERVVQDIQAVVDTPLQIDTINVEALEAALRIYNGKPIINSVNGKEKSMTEVLPLVKKYGACVIGLTLDEGGIPQTAEERLEIAKKIMKKALEYGIPKENLLIDCLVVTASAQQEMVKETVKAVRLVKEELGLKTTLGVSNVSFGLPQRELINRCFLSTALSAGLDAPIMDPLSLEMLNTIRAYRVLANHDLEAKEYIAALGGGQQEISSSIVVDKSLEELIIEGRKAEILLRVEEMLKQQQPLEIINRYFIPALDKIGKGYERGELFLPQLLRSGEAVKAGLEVIKQRSSASTDIAERGKILVATVKGDIHDIGKNIAKMLLENYGYNVIDLGKDVDIEDIISTVKEKDIRLVGLSALMTTTVKNMALTIEALRREVPSCRIMVGGAVLNPEYAQMIEADFYAADGQEGVKIANNVFKDINTN